MALLNPVYAFVVPFLFVVTVPLAVFAGITTTIAFSVLILRVLAVYLDVALSFVPHYLGGRKTRPYHPNTYHPHHQLLEPSPATLYTNPIPASAGSTAFESSFDVVGIEEAPVLYPRQALPLQSAKRDLAYYQALVQSETSKVLVAGAWAVTMKHGLP